MIKDVPLNNKHQEKQSEIKLTSRGRYAVIAMVNLAKGGNDNSPVPLLDIAQESDISLSYLEQLISGLRKNELVKSYRGPGGGYILGRPADQIPIAHILTAAEDSISARKSDKLAAQNCPKTALLWSHIGVILGDHLNKITLDDVLHGKIGT